MRRDRLQAQSDSVTSTSPCTYTQCKLQRHLSRLQLARVMGLLLPAAAPAPTGLPQQPNKAHNPSHSLPIHPTTLYKQINFHEISVMRSQRDTV